MIGILFRGNVQLPPETGWEKFTTEMPDSEEDFDPTLAQEWAEIIRLAKRNRFTVKYTSEGLYMARGKSEGTFKDPRGGLELAKKFLSHHV